MIKKIIFLFLFFSSSFVFAQSCPYGNGNEYANFPAGYPNTGVGTTYYNGLISFQNTCAASQGTPMSYSTGQASPYDKRYYCMLNCSCPVGQEGYSAGADHHGISIMSCRPVCPLGVTRDPNTGICPEASSSSSSSSSSSAPSCDSGFHWDFTVNGLPIEGSTCVPDSSSSSSFSSASSASSASSSVSSPSASSSSSSSSGLTPFQSCELTFGVGNCSAVNENSPCPNSFTSNGQTFCVAVSSGSGSSAGSGGTGGTGGTGTGTGTGEGEGEGECDPESSDYLQCVTPEAGDSPEHTQTASGLNSIDNINKNFTDRLNNSPIVGSMGAIKNIVTLSAASCPQFSIYLFNRDISTTMHCTLWALIAVVLSPIMIAVWSIVAFRIFASA